MRGLPSSTRRLALGVEYDGSAFCGWQAQSGLRCVESELAAAIARVADHPVELVCGGRTDSGVHAAGQVVHFDTPARRRLQAWVLGVNSGLDPRISVSWAAPVAGHFHARFSATARCYRYSILNRMARSALAAGRHAWIPYPLDTAVMQQAADRLVGEHDFSAFRAAECQSRSTVRRVDALVVHREGDVVRIDVRANAFLHHMVRNIAGLLIAVGRGARVPGDVDRILASRDRRQNSATAPAEGLCLMSVVYPGAFGLPGDPL